MKKYLILLAMAAFSLVSKAQTDKEPYLTKSLGSESLSSAKVKTTGGSITVMGGNASEAKLEMYVTTNNGMNTLSKDEIKKRLDENYTIDISVNNNQLVATAKPKNSFSMNWKRSLNISFKLWVPVNVTTDLGTSGGSIQLSNLNGSHTFETSGGSISVDNVKGKMKGRGSGGSIHIAHSSNDIDLATSGGSIHAKNCMGKIKLKTSGGSLQLENLDGNIEAETSGGSIDADNIKGELITSTSGGSIELDNLACTLEAETSGGSIDAEINELGKYVKLRNSGGGITLQLPANKGLDLDLNADKIHVDLKNFSGSKDENSVEGKLNGGGILIDVEASSGKINLTFK